MSGFEDEIRSAGLAMFNDKSSNDVCDMPGEKGGQDLEIVATSVANEGEGVLLTAEDRYDWLDRKACEDTGGFRAAVPDNS